MGWRGRRSAARFDRSRAAKAQQISDLGSPVGSLAVLTLLRAAGPATAQQQHQRAIITQSTVVTTRESDDPPTRTADWAQQCVLAEEVPGGTYSHRATLHAQTEQSVGATRACAAAVIARKDERKVARRSLLACCGSQPRRH